jgi:hypothetical protein
VSAAGHGGFYRVSEPRRSPGAIWAAITRQGIVSPRRNSPSRGVGPDDDAEPAAADIPAVDTDVEAVELTTAYLPEVLRVHDASQSSQMLPCSRQPPRGNQDLSRGQDAHHNSMGTCGAR